MNKIIKFSDLTFAIHPRFVNAKQAIMYFDNGFGLSIIQGDDCYCDDTTYEAAVLLRGVGYIPHELANNDVLPYQTETDIEELIAKVQLLENDSFKD